MSEASLDQAAEEKCVAMLQKASQKVDGQVVRYATRYARPEGRLKSPSVGGLAKATFDASLKAASKAISSGLPNDGWIIVTKAGLGIFGRVPITDGIGSHKGTIPTELIAAVAVAHDKKPGKATITMTFVDQSEAILVTKTRETSLALSLWAKGVADAAAEAAEEVEEPLFDVELLSVH